jgi:hypothetical protein
MLLRTFLYWVSIMVPAPLVGSFRSHPLMLTFNMICIFFDKGRFITQKHDMYALCILFSPSNMSCFWKFLFRRILPLCTDNHIGISM